MPIRSAAAFLGLTLLCSACPVLADVPLDLKKVTGPSAWLGSAVMNAWWAADGRHLYWQQMDSAGGGVLTWEMSTKDGKSTVLTEALPPGLDGPPISQDPTGVRFARVGSDGEVWLIDPDLGEPVRVTTTPDAEGTVQLPGVMRHAERALASRDFVRILSTDFPAHPASLLPRLAKGRGRFGKNAPQGIARSPGTVPPKPGLIHDLAFTGPGIAVEVWALPAAAFGAFVARIPAPWGIGKLSLADGSTGSGFLCEGHALQGAEEITSFGGWRALRAAKA